MIRAWSIAVVAIALAAGPLLMASPAQALACSPVVFDDPQERLAFSVEIADLIVVANVIRERPAIPDGRISYGPDVYDSLIEPIAVLRGEEPTGPIEVRRLNHKADDCLSAARLPEGGPYLLFLSWRSDGYLRGEPYGFHWSLLPVGGKVVFDHSGNAHFDELFQQRNVALGSSEDAIFAVGRMSGSSGREINTALAAISSSTVSRDGRHLPVFAALTVLIAGILLLLYQRLRNIA
jgi:hypothetical protein